jgi:hypothetical protein
LLGEFGVEACLETMKTVFSEEAAELAGPKGRRRPDRTAQHYRDGAGGAGDRWPDVSSAL